MDLRGFDFLTSPPEPGCGPVIAPGSVLGEVVKVVSWAHLGRQSSTAGLAGWMGMPRRLSDEFRVV